MRKFLLVGLLMLALVFLPILSACSSSSSTTASAIPPVKTTTAAAAASAPAAPAASSAQPAVSTTSAAAQSEKILKIGVIGWFGASKHLDAIHGIEVMADMDNKNGGWDIGGEKYKIELDIYDSNNSQTTEVAAVNKLIFQDKVKFIMGTGVYGAAWLPTTEENKVIAMSPTHNYNVALDPKLNYSFEPCVVNGQSVTLIGWLCKNHPELVQNIVDAYPDNQMGHMISGGVEAVWSFFGGKVTSVYYPFEQTDLSSLGTKVATMNPSVFEAIGGGNQDYEAYKAAYRAGYRGQFFASTTNPATIMTQTIPAEALEGYICGALPTEFDPALTQNAIDFKTAWIAKYGNWEDPDIAASSAFACLKEAIKQAGSTDTDKVAAVMANGLKYEGATGAQEMISRPDLGNNRTVDSLGVSYVKVMKSGKPELLAAIGLDEGLSYFRVAFPAK